MNQSSAEPFHTAETDTALTDTAVREETPHRFRLYPTVIVTAVIVCVTVLLTAGWGLFFNRSVKGTWTLRFMVGEQECAVSYSFEDNNVCYFHNGGSIRKGTYKVQENSGEKGAVLLSMTFENFNDFGAPTVMRDMRCSIEGNAFTGRKMKCTDLGGMIFDPDNLEKENAEAVAQKKSAADSVEINGYRYYIFTMQEEPHYTTPMKPFDDARTDDDLLGIWLEKNDDPAYENTFAFYADHTLQITYRDRIYKGCYTAGNGECVFSIAQVDGNFSNISLQYARQEDKLMLTIDGVPSEYTQVDRMDVEP